ncbi:adenosylcobinamide-GDP ribazoletransferase [Floricoccus tropicus]|uniref:adenosylcobinamide-GDP ribazoletransferase n=1 Tax=Floricoccus tropicus TaxID=1859473 RepID=UPI0009F2500F|nr:adenosylcobinamide-GDP ribazoletransferase [Floricoccus tropicus]
MIKDYLSALQFFTRLPILIEIPDFAVHLRKSVGLFPLVGALLGVIEVIVFLIGTMLFPKSMSFIIVLITDAFLTGAFHQDALADTADGLFSARSSDRMLEIMKDSRVGSNGVIALIFYYLLLITPFFSINFSQSLIIKIVFILPLIGKWGISNLFYKMDYAGSENGLGTIFLNVSNSSILISNFICLIFIYLLFGLKGIICYFVILVVTFLYKKYVYSKVKGMNGDTLGAFNCIAQIVFLWTLIGAY